MKARSRQPTEAPISQKKKTPAAQQPQ
jgi:hypothetical protein